MYRHGLIVGKFYPPHLGHRHLIAVAEQACERVSVVLLAAPDESMTVQRRHDLLAAMHPGVRVASSVTSHPIDYDDPYVWDLWEKEIRALCPEAVDAVFSGEDYGDELARRFDAAHERVDRSEIPVSGTLVRSDPRGMWSKLDPSVRAALVRRVCVLGAESTGTSTLALDLAERYGTECVPEYGREFCEIRRTWEPGWTWRSEHFLEIAAGQIELEEQAARRSGPVLICDTDPLATTVWHRRYMGLRLPGLEEMAADRRYALYVLTDSDIDFVQDGTRDGEDIREWMTDAFEAALEARPEPHIVVSGSRSERIGAAATVIDALLAEPWEKW